MQIVNLVMRVFDRTGTARTAAFLISNPFAGLGGACASSDDGDPIVLYDHLADRWLVSQFAVEPPPSPPLPPVPGRLRRPATRRDPVLRSTTTSGTGTKLNDYPHFGVWPDGYYITVNEFTAGLTASRARGMAAFDRAKMLAGDPAPDSSSSTSSTPATTAGMLPSDLDGPPPPAGTPNYFASVTADENGDPGGRHAPSGPSTPTGPPRRAPRSREVTGARSRWPRFNPPHEPRGRNDIAQPRRPRPRPTSTRSQDRLMHRLQYRNFGAHWTLVVNHTVDAGARRRYQAGIALVRAARARRGGPGRSTSRAPTRPTPTTAGWAARPWTRGQHRRRATACRAATSSRRSATPAGWPATRRARSPRARPPHRRQRVADRHRQPLGRLQHAGRRPRRRLHLLVHPGVLLPRHAAPSAGRPASAPSSSRTARRRAPAGR